MAATQQTAFQTRSGFTYSQMAVLILYWSLP